MNGCIYRTKYGECTIPNRSMEYGPLCRSDCTDKHPSNADRIMAMTDEELAEWIESIEPAACPWRDDHGDNCRFTHCHDCWLDWLKQEVDT